MIQTDTIEQSTPEPGTRGSNTRKSNSIAAEPAEPDLAAAKDGDRPTSRRALLGLGAALAAGTVTGEALIAPVGAAQAATGQFEALQAGTRRVNAQRALAHHGKQYATASAAAAAAGRAASELFPHDPKAHLLRRATFGPRPRDVADLDRLGIDGWLERQLHPATIDDARGDRAWKRFPLAGARPAMILKKSKGGGWDAMYQTAQASLARQVFSDRQLFEVVVDVFANHLHVPIPGEQSLTSPSYLRDVIRAHAFGRFDEMLLAAMKHPAMLNFLSNDQSRKANVNENLGRELLELHTVSLAAGYTEKDVRASASILSGRTWDWRKGTYVYDPTVHATGRVRVLGFTHANTTAAGGEAVGDAYLRYLAHHPSTARAVARKLAVRFVSDDPSHGLVQRLADVYLDHDTSIRAVVDAIFKSSDFWAAVGTRMRRPLEDAVGALRVLDLRSAPKTAQSIGWLYWNLNAAGHTPHGWLPPNGYPDVSAAWLGAGAMIQRWNLHRAFAYGWWNPVGSIPPSKLVDWKHGMTTLEWTRLLARHLLGVVPSKRHLTAVIHGASLVPSAPAPTEDWRCGKVVALLLDSPYFQLR